MVFLKLIILYLLFSFNNLYSQTQDTILPRLNLNFELLGITRVLGGANLEYNIIKIDSNKNISLNSGIYLCVGGFANVSNLNFSYGKKYSFETSINLITQFSDLSDNTREYCWYGTNKYRLGATIGLRYIDYENKVFYKFQLTGQLVNTKCDEFNSQTFEKTIIYKNNLPLISIGFIYGIYL